MSCDGCFQHNCGSEPGRFLISAAERRDVQTGTLHISHLKATFPEALHPNNHRSEAKEELCVLKPKQEGSFGSKSVEDKWLQGQAKKKE